MDDVYETLEGIHPPHYMWESEADPEAVVKEAWEHARKLLRDGEGYEAATTMLERLKAHHEHLKPLAERIQSRERYHRLLITRYSRNAAESKIGDDLLDNTPGDEELKANGIDPDHLTAQDVLSFPGDSTWKRAVDMLRKRTHQLRAERRRLNRTLAVIDFRRRVLNTVLYQYEVLGSVGSEPVAFNPFDGTRTAYEHCHTLLDAWNSACERGHAPRKMQHLWREVEALGTPSGAVERATRAVLARVGIRAGNGYESGNPQEYVEAVEKVVRAYDMKG